MRRGGEFSGLFVPIGVRNLELSDTETAVLQREPDDIVQNNYTRFHQELSPSPCYASRAMQRTPSRYRYITVAGDLAVTGLDHRDIAADPAIHNLVKWLVGHPFTDTVHVFIAGIDCHVQFDGRRLSKREECAVAPDLSRQSSSLKCPSRHRQK
jgi:hypothetical protein